MLELENYRRDVHCLQETTKDGDIIRVGCGIAVGVAFLGGNLFSIIGGAVSVCTYLYRVFDEQRITNQGVRWMPSMVGYGDLFLLEAFEDNPVYTALTELNRELTLDVIENRVNQLPKSKRQDVWTYLVQFRINLSKKMDAAEESGENSDSTHSSGVRHLFRYLGIDKAQKVEYFPLDEPCSEPVERLLPMGSTPLNATVEQVGSTVDVEPVVEHSVELKFFDWKQLIDSYDDYPHLLLLGKTGGGKTTLAENLLRYLPGENFVITPHKQPSDFKGFPVHGAGRNFEEIAEAFEWLEEEMDGRYQQWENGTKFGDSKHINVVIDEFTAICRKVKRASEIVQTLVEESRKVRMRLIILSKGDEVKLLGLEGRGSVRKSYTFVHLKGFVDEKAFLRRQNNPALEQWVEAQQYPCVVEGAPADTSLLTSQRQQSNVRPITQVVAPQHSDTRKHEVSWETQYNTFTAPATASRGLSDDAKRLLDVFVNRVQVNTVSVRSLVQKKPFGREDGRNRTDYIKRLLVELQQHGLVQISESGQAVTLKSARVVA